MGKYLDLLKKRERDPHRGSGTDRPLSATEATDATEGPHRATVSTATEATNATEACVIRTSPGETPAPSIATEETEATEVATGCAPGHAPAATEATEATKASGRGIQQIAHRAVEILGGQILDVDPARLDLDEPHSLEANRKRLHESQEGKGVLGRRGE